MLELLPGSKELVYDEATGAHKLLGGANFIYQGNTMYCENAYYYGETKLLKAFGNVHIQKTDNVNLFCDTLYYNGNNGIANMYGNVRAMDSEYKLTTRAMDYNTRTEQGVYKVGGKIENLISGEVLTSRVGYFYPNAKNFFFRGNVDFKSKDVKMTTDTLQYKYSTRTCYFFGPSDIITEDAVMYCEKGWYNVQNESGSLIKNATIQEDSKTISGDTLLYNPKTKISEGFGNVHFMDTTDKVAFSGEYALINDSLNFSLIRKNALIIKYLSDDTLYMHADTLMNQNDSLGNRLMTYGYHDVKIFSNTMQAIADSMTFSRTDEVLELFKNPIVWSKNGELKGDSLKVFMNDSIVNRVYVKNRATVIMEVDSGMYYNQIGGTEINAFFKDNEINYATTIGNAQTVFYPTEEQKSDTANVVVRKGMNRLYASELKVYLDSGEVTGITYFLQPDGVFYPMDKIKESEKLVANFALKFALRPKSKDDLLEYTTD